MLELEERHQRFLQVLRAKGAFSMNCDKCPIKNECFSWIMNRSDDESRNAPTCEEVLLLYILTGETPG